MGCKDIGIRKPEFVAKTQFLLIDFTLRIISSKKKYIKAFWKITFFLFFLEPYMLSVRRLKDWHYRLYPRNQSFRENVSAPTGRRSGLLGRREMIYPLVIFKIFYRESSWIKRVLRCTTIEGLESLPQILIFQFK